MLLLCLIWDFYIEPLSAMITITLRNGEKKMVFRPTIFSVIPYWYFDWIGSLVVKGPLTGILISGSKNCLPTR